VPLLAAREPSFPENSALLATEFSTKGARQAVPGRKTREKRDFREQWHTSFCSSNAV
jgi:hypothetical protein